VVTAFLSYRHETDAHRDSVRDLGWLLEKEGVHVVLDQFAQNREFNGGGPDEGWPRWSKEQAANSGHKVLIIASPGWFRCYRGTELAGAGLGAAAEAGVIEQRLYNQRGVASDIRIVCFDKVDPATLPLDLQRYHRFDAVDDAAAIVNWLKGGIAATSAIVSGWPDEAPHLAWPMADHTEARSAFAGLITRGSKFRLLPVQGSSETGKSLLTRQILGNALRMPGLACGRMDFKGPADLAGQAINTFVQHLGVAAPPASLGLTGQLSKIMTDLAGRAQPALLVFDTFDLAGEAERWARESLLPWLMRAEWLRVVIAGQAVPRFHGEAGADCCAPTIQLQPPAPEDWFAYGQEHRKPGLTLELVRQVHTLCQGKSSLLAQMFGPAA